jgi:GNAT superfamily N-acetyltransferase
MSIEVRRIDSASPDALALVEAMLAELSTHYGPWDPSVSTPSATPEDLAPPGGAFVALYEDGRAVAGGGVKRLAAGMGEIKRMYVVPEARGRGLARVLLGALEDAARELGYARVRLDTGRFQPKAERLYRTSGYREIPDYNDNAYASYWGEKALTPSE